MNSNYKVSFTVAYEFNYENEDDSSIESLGEGNFESCNIVEDMIPDKFRNERTQEQRRWPNNMIPYIFSELFSEKQKNRIESAMREVMNMSCVEFIPRTTEDVFLMIKVSNVYI